MGVGSVDLIVSYAATPFTEFSDNMQIPRRQADSQYPAVKDNS